MSSSNTSLKDNELEEGELEDDNTSEDCIQNPHKTGINELSKTYSDRVKTGSSAVNASSNEHLPLRKSSDGSFWGPVDLFEKHKHFEKKFAWFSNSLNRLSSSEAVQRRPCTENSKKAPLNVLIPRQKYLKDYSKISQDKISNSSFEELLEQYKQIKSELKNYENHPEPVIDSTKKLKAVKEKTRTRNLKASSDIKSNTEAASLKRSKRRQRYKQNKKERKQLLGNSSRRINQLDIKNGNKQNSSSLRAPISLDEEDEDELELRRIALESAFKQKDEKSDSPIQTIVSDNKSQLPQKEYSMFLDKNLSRCLKEIKIIDTSKQDASVKNTEDNYENIEMDIDSDFEGEVDNASVSILPDQNATSKIQAQDLKDALISDAMVDEDEEILRAQLLMSLARPIKMNNEVDVSSNNDNSSLLNRQMDSDLAITDAGEASQSINQRDVSVACDVSTSFPVENSRVVINLAEDSSDSEQEETKESSDQEGVFASISSFIKDVREKSVQDVFPKYRAVSKLSHSQQLEYYRLKAEIAKREKIKMVSNVSSPVSSAPQSPKQDSKKQISLNQLNEFEQLLIKNRQEMNEEQQKVKQLKVQLQKIKIEYKNSEAKISALKQQLQNAEKASRVSKLKIQSIDSQISSIQSSRCKKFFHLRSLTSKCDKLGRELKGSSYSLPSNDKKRVANVKSLPKAKKQKLNPASDSNTLISNIQVSEKNRLKSLEKEIAARLEQLRKKMGTAQKQDSKENNVIQSMKSKSPSGSTTQKRIRRKSLLELDPTTTPNLPIDASLSKIVTPELKFRNMAENLGEEKLGMLKKLTSQTFTLPVDSKRARSKKLIKRPHLMGAKQKKGRQFIMDKFSPYQSPLLSFRSYRFSPYFKQTLNHYTSNSICHTIDVRRPLCRFDLTGVCNDDQCSWQHEDNYKMSVSEILVDLASHAPTLIPDLHNVVEETAQFEAVKNYCKKVIGVSELNEVAKEDYCTIFIDHLNRHRERGKLEYVVLDDRKWKPSRQKKDSDKLKKAAQDLSGNDLKYDAHVIKDPTSDDSGTRYFICDDLAITDMEAAVLDDTSNVELWLKLSQYHLLNKTNNNLERALNALSRGLEFNKSSAKLWSHYLELYSRWPNNNIQSLCEKAIQFSSDYAIWQLFLKVTKGFSKKQEICDQILIYLQNEECDPDIKSHRIIETVLFKCQLNLRAGYHQSASAYLQEAIGLKSTSKSMVDFINMKDCCFLWLCFIHIIEFNTFPHQSFDHNDDNFIRVVSKENIVINWQSHVKLQTSVDQLIAYFRKALNQCKKKSKRSVSNTEELLPLYFNLINLELYRGGCKSAIRMCRKLLEVQPSSKQLWCFLLCISAGSSTVADYISVPIFVSKQELLPYLYPLPATGNLQSNTSNLCSEGATTNQDESRPSAADTLLEVYSEACQAIPNCSLFTHLVVSFLQNDVTACKKLLCTFMTKLKGTDVDDDQKVLIAYRKILNYAPWMTHKKLEEKPDESSDVVHDVHLWLNYCYLLEVLKYPHADIIEAYEAAVWSNPKSCDLKKIWCQYLCYMLMTMSKDQSLISFDMLFGIIKRCLMTVPIKRTLPSDLNHTWYDFHFHNKVIDILLSHVDDGQAKIDMHHEIVAMYPNNAAMINRSLRYFVSMEDWTSTRYICDFYSKRGLPSTSFWKTYDFHLVLGNFSNVNQFNHGLKYLESTKTKITIFPVV